MIRINLLKNPQNLPVPYQPIPLAKPLSKKEEVRAIQPTSEKFPSSWPKMAGLNLYAWMTDVPVTSSLLLAGLAGWLGGAYLALPVLILAILFIYTPKSRYMSIGEEEEKRGKEIKDLSARTLFLKDRLTDSFHSFDPAQPLEAQLQTDLSELWEAFNKLESLQKRTARMRKNLVFQAHLKADVMKNHDQVLERQFQHLSEKVEQLRWFFEDLSLRQPSLGVYRLRSNSTAEPAKLPMAKIQK